jgi:hypothetical protein
MKTQILWRLQIFILFLVLGSSYGVHSGDNLYSVNTAMGKTKTQGGDFSILNGQCLGCMGKKPSTTEMVKLPREFNMNHKNEKPTDTMESQPYFECDTKELVGKTMDNYIQ